MLRRSVSSITENIVVAQVLAEFKKHGFAAACRIASISGRPKHSIASGFPGLSRALKNISRYVRYRPDCSGTVAGQCSHCQSVSLTVICSFRKWG